MIGKLLRRAGLRHGVGRVTALRACVASTLVLVILPALPAAAQTPPLYHQGMRWIGTASVCFAPPGWTAARLLQGTHVPPALAGVCLYTWNLLGQGVPPTPADIAALRNSGASNLTEDVPVIYPATSPEEVLLTSLRAALRAHVGDVSLAPGAPSLPAVRIAVIDSAPDAPAGHIRPGASRHGDTLAHLIEDIVCTTTQGEQRCAAEVTTVLALPWRDRNTLSENGGHVGSLADLTKAIHRAVSIWQDDLAQRPSTTPARLLLNLSLGWEDTPGVADCATGVAAPGSPASLVQQVLGYASAQGALIIAAAGNDSGGPQPRTGLVCPGRYQAIADKVDTRRSLLFAVSGVDYQDRPLQVTRPLGVTALVGLGLGGIAWGASDPMPALLAGSSVATAVVSAVSAVVWSVRPSVTAGQVVTAVYQGGHDVASANACPRGVAPCIARRVSVCGALHGAGVPADCSPPPPLSWSCPDLPGPVAAYDHSYAGAPRLQGSALPVPIPRSLLPRYQTASVQVDPWVFPAPISTTCRTCVANDAQAFDSTILPHLDLVVTQTLSSPVLVVQFSGGDPQAVALGAMLLADQPHVVMLPASWDMASIESAYLTGLDGSGHSVTEQILVQH